ncbi:hypothetical protein PtB15_13B518 [Puccinia triticina]|nr:hypothetical protein PtB15_13B518 [Puccinia triticina]
MPVVMDPASPLLTGDEILRFHGRFKAVRPAPCTFRLPNGGTQLASKAFARSTGLWTNSKAVFPIHMRPSESSNSPLHPRWRNILGSLPDGIKVSKATVAYDNSSFIGSERGYSPLNDLY